MPEVGDRLGDKYRLEAKLGEGGMGAVFEAVHEQIGKRVAIKCLHASLAADKRLVARFQKEAQAAAAVGHRGIVEIFDIGVAEDGSPYLVMELLPGESLAALLGRQGRLEVDAAAYVACQVLSALAAAHRAGIVHRDLKPDNVFLVETGAALADVKLLDFGISRVLDTAGVLPSTRITEAGSVMGTPSYMSPEQCRGELDVDGRTDLYAMGVILYRALGGALPFEAPNYNALMQRIIAGGPEPLRSRAPELPAELESVVARAMALDRAARPRDAAELFEALLPFVDERARARVSMPTSGRSGVSVPAPAIGEAETAPIEVPRTRPRAPDAEKPLPRTLVASRPGGEPRRGRGGRWIVVAAVVATLGAAAGIAAVLAGGRGQARTPVRVEGLSSPAGPAPAPDPSTPSATEAGPTATLPGGDAGAVDGGPGRPGAGPGVEPTPAGAAAPPADGARPAVERGGPPVKRGGPPRTGEGGSYGREVDGPPPGYGHEVD